MHKPKTNRLTPSALGFVASLVVVALLFYAARTTAVILRSVYFIVLVFVALAAAGFLFGVLKKSSTHYDGQLPLPEGSPQTGRVVMKGPAALFFIVLVLGIVLAPPEKEKTLKVFLKAPNENPEVLSSAQVSITLQTPTGTVPYPQAPVRSGYASFEGIPVGLTTGSVHVVVATEHFKQLRTDYEFPSNGALDVTLERIPEQCLLNAIVESQRPARRPVPGAKIKISGMTTPLITGPFGTVTAVVPFPCGKKIDAVVQDPQGHNFQTIIVVAQDGITQSEIVIPPI
jgi:hypothetical protein